MWAEKGGDVDYVCSDSIPRPNTNWEAPECGATSVSCQHNEYIVCEWKGISMHPPWQREHQLSAASLALPGVSVWPMKRLHHDRTVELSSLSCYLQAQRGWVTCPRSHSCLEENHTPPPHAAANLFPGLLPLSFLECPFATAVSMVQI